MATPYAPINLVAKVISDSTIDLTWKNPQAFDDVCMIYRKPYGGAYALLVNINGTDETYSDTSCADGTLYYYKVRGRNDAGGGSYTYSGYSNEVNGTTTLPKPTNLVGVADSATQITLTWEDNSDNETGFLVYMKTGTAAYALVHTTAAAVKTYAKTGLAASTKYFFYVRATNSHITSGYSNVIALSTKNDGTGPVTLSNTAHHDILIIDTIGGTIINPNPVTVVTTVTTSDVLTRLYDVVCTDGAVSKIDATHSDNGYPVSSYIRTKDLDFTDQHPDIAGMIKTIRKFRLIYEDMDADTPITVYISNDGGINWDTATATIGTGDGRVKTRDFYFMNSEYVTGMNFTFKVDCLSTTKSFLWLAFEIEFFERGEYFNV
jgi:hypothetical protein